jgi:NAD(P)H-hydrate epimerase
MEVIKPGRGFVVAISHDPIPAVTAEQMREVDRAMLEDIHIQLAQMMENAGRSLAELSLHRFGPRQVLVLAGPGGNGGGGLVAARHLANRGAHVDVVLSEPDRMRPIPAQQLDIARRMHIDVAQEPRIADLVIDALIGYSLSGNPTGRAAALIDWINDQSAPVLALDTPSGLDVTNGQAGSPCVRATATMTLALPKPGLLHSGAVGELYLADISVPEVVYTRMRIQVPNIFHDAPIVRLNR